MSWMQSDGEYGGGDFDKAYIHCGCTYDNGDCDSDGRCAYYDDNQGMWKCNDASDVDLKEENEMLRLRGSAEQSIE